MCKNVQLLMYNESVDGFVQPNHVVLWDNKWNNLCGKKKTQVLRYSTHRDTTV
jgi:hypothetical protein